MGEETSGVDKNFILLTTIPLEDKMYSYYIRSDFHRCKSINISGLREFLTEICNNKETKEKLDYQIKQQKKDR